jgi:uncharacterized phage protein (TIGR01671 family)
MKYRIWHKPSKQFTTCAVFYSKKKKAYTVGSSATLYLSPDGSLVYEHWSGVPYEPAYIAKAPDEYVVQRATPFGDKNGQRIYEGDLVSFEASSEQVALQGIAVHIFEVFFNEDAGAFYLRYTEDKTTECASDYLSVKSDCRVCGNCFEGYS